jgi:hypothetical protein
MEHSLTAEDQTKPSYWIVICPEPNVRGGVWRRWYEEQCVAVGWYPPTWSFEGQGENTPGWTIVQNRLREIRPGDKVIPFLLKWRVGPVGTVQEVKAKDLDWNPTVEKGKYSGSEGHDELGRRVLVTWEQGGMPPNGMIATVPLGQRPGGRAPLARHTIEELSAEQFQNLCSVLSKEQNWSQVGTATGTVTDDAEIADTEVPPPPPPPEALSLLERDLQKFLSRNLGVIEKGLKPDPAYQLEEYSIDVGRIDLLCKDSHDNWVVIELKADWAGDDAVGQILGYMSWVKENLPNGTSVRGIIICKNTTGRVKAALKWVPNLSIKRFTLNFSMDEIV